VAQPCSAVWLSFLQAKAPARKKTQNKVSLGRRLNFLIFAYTTCVNHAPAARFCLDLKTCNDAIGSFVLKCIKACLPFDNGCPEPIPGQSRQNNGIDPEVIPKSQSHKIGIHSGSRLVSLLDFGIQKKYSACRS
jgi:hypothetical protein